MRIHPGPTAQAIVRLAAKHTLQFTSETISAQNTQSLRNIVERKHREVRDNRPFRSNESAISGIFFPGRFGLPQLFPKEVRVVTGEPIQLEKYRDVKKIQLFRPRPAPRDAAAEACRASIVDLRVARITRLLTELEELTRLPKHVPSTILDQARDGLEKARSVVGAPTPAVDLGRAPQPELDDERIERMYRELNQHA